MPLSKHFRFCLWWESDFNGGHFSTCQTRKIWTPVTFSLYMRHVFLRPGGSLFYDEKCPLGRFRRGSLFVVTPASQLFNCFSTKTNNKEWQMEIRQNCIYKRRCYASDNWFSRALILIKIDNAVDFFFLAISSKRDIVLKCCYLKLT